jgi:hypothetical protein
MEQQLLRRAPSVYVLLKEARDHVCGRWDSLPAPNPNH